MSYRRRRKKNHASEDVELNLAAMLDMAFQLLTFFILTFRPAPVEGQISLRLPPPQGLVGGTAEAGKESSETETPKGLNTFVLTVYAKSDGSLGQIRIGESSPLPNVWRLDRELASQFADDSNPFNQVLLQVASDLRYSELMKVIDVCTKQTIYDSEQGKRVPLSKLSFVEMDTGGTE